MKNFVHEQSLRKKVENAAEQILQEKIPSRERVAPLSFLCNSSTFSTLSAQVIPSFNINFPF